MIKGKIDVTKILKDELYQGKTAKYLDLVMFPNTNELGDEVPDQYGQTGVIKQSLSKTSREAGMKSPILGNYTITEKNPSGFVPKMGTAFKKRTPAPAPAAVEDEDEIPF